MIYLIKLATFCEDIEDMTKDTAELVLKIGYTNDDRKKSRFLDYIASGHRIRIIKTIPGGSSELEHRVQKYFAKYRFPGRSQEWFCNVPEIIDAFNSCETVEDLENFAVSESDAMDKKKKSMYSWPKIYEDIEFSDLTKNKVQLIRLKKELYTLCIELTTFPDKLKYLCEKVDSEDLTIFLQVLPEDFKKYYEVLGSDRLKANGYRRSELEKEYLDALSNFDEIRSLVYSKFEVGVKYSRETIKKGLQEIYKTCGLNKTATAQSIKEFFNVDEKKFTDPQKNTRVSGYLIVSKIE